MVAQQKFINMPTADGTDTIRITGQETLHGTNYTVIPDQIETGTLMIAAAAELFPERTIIVHHSMPFGGYYCERDDEQLQTSRRLRRTRLMDFKIVFFWAALLVVAV